MSLKNFFEPSSVAVVGASDTEGKLGHALMMRLEAAGFPGRIFPINDKKQEVLGLKAYPNVGSLPEVPGLVVIATPARTVPDIISECEKMGVRSVLIISAGFKETGPEGAELEKEILRRKGKEMRIVGPNCLGIMSPLSRLDVTFAARMAISGDVACVSQSGALLTAILGWAYKERVGFSRIVSIGSMLDVDWGDILLYLGSDAHTKSIVLYAETIGNARRFVSAAREVALKKPIFIIKPGRTKEAAKAAASHTGSLAGNDAILDEVFRRSGVFRVDDIAELFYMTAVAKQPLPRGPRLLILTNAGGPGVLATDKLIAKGGVLTPLTESTLKALNEALKGIPWSGGNPLDVIGDADPERFKKATEIALLNPSTDGILIILTPQKMTDPTAVAEKVVEVAKGATVPVFASWMGGEEVEEGKRILAEAGIPVFPYPDTAAKMFTYSWERSQVLAALYEKPRQVDGLGTKTPEMLAADALIARVRKSRTILTEIEAKGVLAAYGIPVTSTVAAATEEEAVRAAERLGYPAVVKINSGGHKTDMGGVKLDLKTEDEVRKAYRDIGDAYEMYAGTSRFEGVTVQPMMAIKGYELLIGSTTDPQIGPAIIFGLGGTLVEVFKDTSIGIPPLTTALARQMMERTKIFAALEGVRGNKAVNIKALENLVVKFAEFVHHHPEVKEVDLNPVLASPEKLAALDARIVLYPKDAELPESAFRPYPTDWSWYRILGSELIIFHPLRAEDVERMSRFHETLTDKTVIQRYHRKKRLAARQDYLPLAQRCALDFIREMAFVAETQKGDIIGVGRLICTGDDPKEEAELALVISDNYCGRNYQGRGIGGELLRALVSWGKQEGIRKLSAVTTFDNPAAIALLKKERFNVEYADREVDAELRP